PPCFQKAPETRPEKRKGGRRGIKNPPAPEPFPSLTGSDRGFKLLFGRTCLTQGVPPCSKDALSKQVISCCRRNRKKAGRPGGGRPARSPIPQRGRGRRSRTGKGLSASAEQLASDLGHVAALEARALQFGFAGL